MTNESFLAITCAALIALTYGMFLSFLGYRFFLFLLPIWGFFFGFSFGAHTLQALFGEGFLATVTSWVVAAIVAVAGIVVQARTNRYYEIAAYNRWEQTPA